MVLASTASTLVFDLRLRGGLGLVGSVGCADTAAGVMFCLIEGGLDWRGTMLGLADMAVSSVEETEAEVD